MFDRQEPTAAPARAAFADARVSVLIPLLWEINNLKRVRAAQFEGSFAENLFRRAWKAVASGADVRRTALKIAADAIAGANLGAIDRTVLRSADLSENEIDSILNRGFDAATKNVVEENLKRELREFLNSDFDFGANRELRFVELLARQPRSGATKIGAPKLVFDSPENHAEHCASVAVYAVLLAPVFAADIETVFLAALAHHFHNAHLPDSGFAGEEMLGDSLPRVFAAFRHKCLAELPVNLRPRVAAIFPLIESAETPEAKTFHAADVLDRVLQMRHHAEANGFTLRYALEEMELVHAGAIQQFHYEILRAAKIVE